MRFHEKSFRNLRCCADSVTLESLGPFLHGRRGAHRCPRRHRPDDVCQNLGGLVIAPVQGQTHKGLGGTKALEQHRAIDVVVHSYDALPLKRVQYFAGAPFVPAIPDNLQHNRLVIASAEHEDRALGLHQVLDRDPPSADSLLHSAPVFNRVCRLHVSLLMRLALKLRRIDRPLLERDGLPSHRARRPLELPEHAGKAFSHHRCHWAPCDDVIERSDDWIRGGVHWRAISLNANPFHHVDPVGLESPRAASGASYAWWRSLMRDVPPTGPPMSRRAEPAGAPQGPFVLDTQASRPRRPIDTHVVDDHRRREDCIRLWIPVECPTDGQIQDQEERLVEYRFAKLLDFAARDPVVDGIVDEESYGERIPFDGERVEVVREGATLQRMRVSQRSVPGVARTVHRRARRGRLAPTILHDVELTALRPRRRRKATPEHPERGPESLPSRQLDACFYTAGLDMHLAARRDLGGRVPARTVVTGQARGSTPGDDQQLPLSTERDVCG